MAYNTKSIKKDLDVKPIPQYFNPTLDDYEPLYGRNGANRVELYGPDGTPIGTTSGKLNVRASEIEALAGALVDAAVTDPAASASIIALLKGLLKQIQGGATTISPVDVTDRVARVLGKVTADDGALATLGALANAAVTDPTAAASVIALLKGLIKQLQGNGTGQTPVKLVDNTITDAAAVPTQMAIKDATARAIDAICDTIGVENIQMFLPCWEASGTKLYDLLDHNLTFDLYGPTLAVSSPFGRAVSFDGVNDYAKQTPVTEAQNGNSYVNIDAGTKAVAQKLVPFTNKVACVRMKIQKIGAPVGTLAAEIVEDNAGQPTGASVSTSTTFDVSTAPASTLVQVGFYFSAMPALIKSKTYWLKLQWATATTVDVSNYVQILYDSAGAYGQPRASYDGTTWTVTTGQSHYFEIYNNKLQLKDDFSIVLLLYPPVIGVNAVLQYARKDLGYGALFRYDPVECLMWIQTISGTGNAIYSTNVTGYHVMGLTFSKTASTGKTKAYLDGRLHSQTDGIAGVDISPVYGPITLGAYESPYGNGYTHGACKIGAIIIAKTVLTDAQMAKVAHYLLPNRKRWGTE